MRYKTAQRVVVILKIQRDEKRYPLSSLKTCVLVWYYCFGEDEQRENFLFSSTLRTRRYNQKTQEWSRGIFTVHLSTPNFHPPACGSVVFQT